MVVLTLVHSPDYLIKLWKLAHEARSTDMLVPLEFDTEWENTESEPESDNESEEEKSPPASDVPCQFTFGEGEGAFTLELAPENQCVYRALAMHQSRQPIPTRPVGRRRKRRSDEAARRPTVVTPYGTARVLSEAYVPARLQATYQLASF